MLALAGYAWVASAAAPFSGRALVSVLVPGAALGVLACGRPPVRSGAFLVWLLAGWALVRR